MKYPGFIGSSYASQAVTADQERTVNWYEERMESRGATSQSALYPTPGVERIALSAYGPGRAHFFEDGREFAVFGTKFHEIGQYGLLTERGNVAIGSNPATISSNGDGGGQLFITSGDNGYIYDKTSHVFTQVTALNGKATMGDSLDGYFLLLDAATSTFYISDLLDGLTWDTGTAFAQRNIAPDPWRSMKKNGRYVWLLGEHTSEVWYDSGAASFPFAPHPSGLIPHGIGAPFSVAVADGQIIWLGASRLGDRYVLRASGFTPEVVSDYALQWAFSKYNTITDAIAECFNYLGHVFYRITFPVEKDTRCWDVQQGKWFEWRTWISEENRWDACRAHMHVKAFGEHRMLDTATGALYRMSASLGLDVDSRPIRRMRRAPALTKELQPIFYKSFELDLEPGLGDIFPSSVGGIRITTGVNDLIPTNFGGGTNAVIAEGLYLTMDDVVTAVLAALRAVVLAQQWFFTYDPGRNRFSLGSFLPNPIQILFGTSTQQSAGETLGFWLVDIPSGTVSTADGPPILTPTAGAAPHVMLRLSNDGGKTWGTEMMRPTGKSGEYGKRVRWDRLGRARRRVFEVTVSDPVPFRLTDAFIELGQPLKGAQSSQPGAAA